MSKPPCIRLEEDAWVLVLVLLQWELGQLMSPTLFPHLKHKHETRSFLRYLSLRFQDFGECLQMHATHKWQYHAHNLNHLSCIGIYLGWWKTPQSKKQDLHASQNQYAHFKDSWHMAQLCVSWHKNFFTVLQG